MALIPLIQVSREADGAPLVFHVPEADLISDEAVLFVKILNIEKNGYERAHLNHFNRIGNHNPISFLEDLPSVHIPSCGLAPIPVGSDTQCKAAGRTGSTRSNLGSAAECTTVHGQLQLSCEANAVITANLKRIKPH